MGAISLLPTPATSWLAQRPLQSWFGAKVGAPIGGGLEPVTLCGQSSVCLARGVVTDARPLATEAQITSDPYALRTASHRLCMPGLSPLSPIPCKKTVGGNLVRSRSTARPERVTGSAIIMQATSRSPAVVTSAAAVAARHHDAADVVRCDGGRSGVAPSCKLITALL